MIIYSVLKIFKLSLLVTNQSQILVNSDTNSTLISLACVNVDDTLVSSAFKEISQSLAIFCKSFVYMTNSSGPRIEPCVTSQVTGSKLYTFPLTLQHCTLFDRYDFNRDKSLLCRPYRHSFSSNISSFTVSKAFLKSRNLTTFAFPLSMFTSQLLIDLWNACMVE